MSRLVPFTLLLLALLAAPAAASPGQVMTFEAPRELLDDSTRDETLDEIRGFGVDRIRVLVYWDQFAPSPDAKRKPSFDAADPAAYPSGTWDRLDRVFAAAQARGITVQPTLTGPVPRWATKAKRDRVTEPSAAEFKRFATAVGRRYGDRVKLWSIWNEPNHPQFLKPQFRNGRAASPRIYRRLVIAGVTGIRSSADNAADLVLMGETAPRGTPRVVAPLAFLRTSLCLNGSYRRIDRCGQLPVDGYAHHAYTTKAGPSFKPGNRDDVTIGVLPRLTNALERAGRAGAIPRRLGVYLTEFGIQSEPDPFAGVSLARQAEYLAMAEKIAYRNPHVRSFSQYLLRDDQPRPGGTASRYGGFESGLRHSDGRIKPAWYAFRLPLVADRRGGSVALWGRVRPATGPTDATIVDGDGAVVATVRTDARGVFTARVTHRSGRRYRLRWTAPGGTAYEGPLIRAY